MEHFVGLEGTLNRWRERGKKLSSVMSRLLLVMAALLAAAKWNWTCICTCAEVQDWQPYSLWTTRSDMKTWRETDQLPLSFLRSIVIVLQWQAQGSYFASAVQRVSVDGVSSNLRLWISRNHWASSEVFSWVQDLVLGDSQHTNSWAWTQIKLKMITT